MHIALRTQVPFFARHAADVCVEHGLMFVHEHTARREDSLRREGFVDVFKQVKAEENAKALQLLPNVIA